MYVEMHSVDEMKDESSGKTSWINSSNYDLGLTKHKAKHLGSPPWYIAIEASQYHHPNGEQDIKRTVIIHLTPEDIEMLLKTLSDKDLLKIDRISLAKGLKPSLGTADVKKAASKKTR
jgi:hypothetical protein